jgi:hypothetical protein
VIVLPAVRLEADSLFTALTWGEATVTLAVLEELVPQPALLRVAVLGMTVPDVPVLTLSKAQTTPDTGRETLPRSQLTLPLVVTALGPADWRVTLGGRL